MNRNIAQEKVPSEACLRKFVAGFFARVKRLAPRPLPETVSRMLIDAERETAAQDFTAPTEREQDKKIIPCNLM